jgi:hypothetical protein
MRSWKQHYRGLSVMLLLLVSLTVWLIGCTANEPFDPDALENLSPIARLFVPAPEEGEEFNPTSYFSRTFNWSGTDSDGWVTDFYISIQTEEGVPAPWDTTSATDTTMTFAPDPMTGEASATILIACRDNRGAFSDTISQFIPMRNHPPVVRFTLDFDPLVNMQRELVVEPDSFLYWNWGPCNFRLAAYDPDGLNTMDSFFRYTLAEGDPDQEWEADDPDADPEVGWLREDFGSGDESFEFGMFVSDLSPGLKTLTISVKDEAGGDAWFQYSWEVRAPKNSILYFFDNAGPTTRAVYYEFLNQTFGQDNWDEYIFVFGYPDATAVLVETMKLFDVVLWADGGSPPPSPLMQNIFSRFGAMAQYLDSSGRLILVSKNITEVAGEAALSNVFVQTHLGIDPEFGLPRGFLEIDAGKRAMPVDEAPHMPVMYKNINFGDGRGFGLLEGTEALYRMEHCLRCYNSLEPWDPVVGYRRPPRLDEDDNPQFASVVGFGLMLEYFSQNQAIAVLQHVLTDEMGLTP